MMGHQDEATGMERKLADIRVRIRAACRVSGRQESDITLVAAGKTKPWEQLAELARLGVRDFGENYVQEAREKQERAAAGGFPGLRWHLIGTLQSKKAKQVAGNFHLFHALDSLSLATKLDNAASAANLVQCCLLEVNVDLEDSKGGMAESQLPRLLEELSPLRNLRVTGLMCLPAPGRDPRGAFSRLRGLREKMNAAGAYRYKLTELSMGMSGDFEAAIAEGATLVRVGSLLFGAREKPAGALEGKLP
jgi:pyridoxal phosphate enzyme (YggS family)